MSIQHPLFKIKNNFLILFFLIISQELYSQSDFKPGFIITLSDDTIHGFVDHRTQFLNTNECNFKKSLDSKPETYLPDQIKAYWIDNAEYYVSKKINGKSYFLEFLVDGIVNLYSFKKKGEEDEKIELFYIEKDTALIEMSNYKKTIVNDKGNMFESQSNRYKGVLNYLFYDDPKIATKIKTTRFNKGSLMRITKKYHNDVCSEYACIDYSKSAESVIYIGPKFGIINSTMRLKNSSETAKDTPQLSYGIQIGLRPNGLFYRWKLLSGVEFSSNTFDGHYKGTFNKILVIYHIAIKSDIVRIPIAIQYTFPRKGIQPLFYLGYNNVLLTHATHYTALKPQYGTGNESKMSGYDVLHKYNFGLMAGAGFNMNFSDKLSSSLKIDFEYRFPYNKVNDETILDRISVNSLAISVGCFYKISFRKKD